MDLAAIIILLSLGLVLLLLEVVFIPGTTVFGIFGFILIVAAVIITYNAYGARWGGIAAGGTLFLGIGMLFWALRSKPWNRYSLKSTIDSKVNNQEYFELAPGQKGKTVSSLRPQGKAEFGGNLYNVRTNGDFLSSDTEVVITRIKNNIIFVEEFKS